MENSERDGNTRPPYLPPENLYADQEATVRTGRGYGERLKAGGEGGDRECDGWMVSTT